MASPPSLIIPRQVCRGTSRGGWDRHPRPPHRLDHKNFSGHDQCHVRRFITVVHHHHFQRWDLRLVSRLRCLAARRLLQAGRRATRVATRPGGAGSFPTTRWDLDFKNLKSATPPPLAPAVLGFFILRKSIGSWLRVGEASRRPSAWHCFSRMIEDMCARRGRPLPWTSTICRYSRVRGGPGSKAKTVAQHPLGAPRRWLDLQGDAAPRVKHANVLAVYRCDL
jgi:hypothetical protein